MLPQFQVPSVLLGLFLRKLDVQDFRQLAESLPWRLPEFDGPTRLAQGLPPNAPPDAARIQFNSKDGRRVLEVAPGKIQFRMMPGEISAGDNGSMNLRILPFDDSMANFEPLAAKIHSVFAEHYGAKANRVGMFVEFLAPLGFSANQRIQERYLGGTAAFGERLHEVAIQALSRVAIEEGGRQINRWIRVRSVRSNDEGSPDVAIAVEADINTLPEDSYDITAAELEKFIGAARTHLNERVPLFSDEALFKA